MQFPLPWGRFAFLFRLRDFAIGRRFLTIRSSDDGGRDGFDDSPFNSFSNMVPLSNSTITSASSSVIRAACAALPASSQAIRSAAAPASTPTVYQTTRAPWRPFARTARSELSGYDCLLDVPQLAVYRESTQLRSEESLVDSVKQSWDVWRL